MVSVIGMFSQNSFAENFAANARAAARPNFELAFNNMQNTIIDRLNKEVEKLTEDSGLINNIDPFLISAEKKLSKFQTGIHSFIYDNSRNMEAVGEMQRLLNLLDTALVSDDTGAFNSSLEHLNATVSNTIVTNGWAVGMYISDGIEIIKRDGLLSIDVSGTLTQANAYADFADKTAAEDAVTAARATIETIAGVLLVKGDSAEKLMQNTDKNLTSTRIQIETTLIAQQAEKAAEIGKLKQKYSQLLNSISLSFEVSSAMADQFAANLFGDGQVQKGSVMNLFT